VTDDFRIVTKEEIEQPRAARDIRGWIDGALHRFNATPELKAMFRAGKDAGKILREESLPLAIFAANHFHESGEVVITHKLGNQSYDATVADRRTPPGCVRFVELTSAWMTRQEALRSQILARDGHVPAYGPVIERNENGERVEPYVVLEAHDHADLVAGHLPQIRAAIVRKAENTYPRGTALVVFVDEHGPFRLEEDRADLRELAETQFKQLVDGREFCLLALVGSGTLYIEVELTLGAPDPA
jgi:hypothetical protein